MTSPRAPRTPPSVRFRSELVVKPDGRYLIYYSWPDEPDNDVAAGDGQKSPAPPEQAPWSPETGPADV